MNDKRFFSNNNHHSTVIIGSFRKHLSEIISIKNLLELSNIKVLSPVEDKITNPEEEFIFFESDLILDPKFLQDAVFSKIKQSTFVVVANVNGYLGRATTMEIGYAIAEGIPIYTLEPMEDVHISPYSRLLIDIFPAIDKVCCEHLNNRLIKNGSII